VAAICNINWITFTEEIPPNYDFPDSDSAPYACIIGPKQTSDIIETTIPPKTLQLVAMRKLNLYVWGWIEYNDVFSHTPRRRTEFCARINLHGNPEESGCIMLMRIHSRHNGADESCEKKPPTN
jgi:hypothetical protein